MSIGTLDTQSALDMIGDLSAHLNVSDFQAQLDDAGQTVIIVQDTTGREWRAKASGGAYSLGVYSLRSIVESEPSELSILTLNADSFSEAIREVKTDLRAHYQRQIKACRERAESI